MSTRDRVLGWLGSRARLVFGLDTRSLAVARISLGLIVILDVLNRVSDYRFFYTESGALPRQALMQYLQRRDRISLFMASGADWWAGVSSPSKRPQRWPSCSATGRASQTSSCGSWSSAATRGEHLLSPGVVRDTPLLGVVPAHGCAGVHRLAARADRQGTPGMLAWPPPPSVPDRGGLHLDGSSQDRGGLEKRRGGLLLPRHRSLRETADGWLDAEARGGVVEPDPSDLLVRDGRAVASARAVLLWAVAGCDGGGFILMHLGFWAGLEIGLFPGSASLDGSPSCRGGSGESSAGWSRMGMPRHVHRASVGAAGFDRVDDGAAVRDVPGACAVLLLDDRPMEHEHHGWKELGGSNESVGSSPPATRPEMEHVRALPPQGRRMVRPAG